MSKNYSKAELRGIAKSLVEELRECEDGTGISSWELLQCSGYDMDSFDQWDLFEVHDALLREARANHITLDMSAHKDQVEGLPYNLDFIVRNKKAQIKCPRCGSMNTARYIYGMPIFSERMQQKLNARKWVLGGCCISSVEVNGKEIDTMPARRCNDCKKDFATAPILFTPKSEKAEDYRDIVTSIKFSVGGFFSGHTDVSIIKNEQGALVQVQKLSEPDEEPDDRQINAVKWQKIVNTLYGQMYLHEWKRSFVDPCVMDGTQWRLEIGLTKKRKRSYSGSNDYPPYWSKLLRIFREFVKV